MYMAKNKRGNKKGLAVACLLASICGKTGAMEKPVNNKVAVQRTNPEKSSNLKKVLIVGGTIFGLGAFGAGIYGLTKLFGDKEELENGNQKPVEDPIKKEYFDILRSFYEPNTEYGADYWCKDDNNNNNDNILDIQKFYSSSQTKCIEDTDKFLAYCTFALTFGKVSESGEITYEGYRGKKKLSIKLQIDKKQNNMRLEAKEDDGVKYYFYINLPKKHDDSINEKKFKIYLFNGMLDEFEYAIIPTLESENEKSKTFFKNYYYDKGYGYDNEKINGILDDFDNSGNDGTLDATGDSCLRLFKVNFEVSNDLTQLKATYNLIDKKDEFIDTNEYSIKINPLTEPGREEPGDDEVNDKKENSDSQNIYKEDNSNDDDDIGLGGLF